MNSAKVEAEALTWDLMTLIVSEDTKRILLTVLMRFFRIQRIPNVTPARLQEKLKVKENYVEMGNWAGARYEHENSYGDVVCVVVSIMNEKKL